MAKTKEIQYPTQEWLDKWYDKYENNHPEERINYDELKESAECEWWDAQIEKGNPTPYDFTKEEQKQVKKLLGNAKAKKPPNYSLAGKKPRERKPNEEKRAIIEYLNQCLTSNEMFAAPTVVNVEKEITFNIGANSYSISLICHRPPKEDKN